MSTPLTPLGDDHRADHAPSEPGPAESTLAETPAPHPDGTGRTPVVLDSGAAVTREGVALVPPLRGYAMPPSARKVSDVAALIAAGSPLVTTS